MAIYGLACVFLCIVAAIVFLLPTSLVSAEPASGGSGGVYRWVSEGISRPMGFLAVWCQFAMTIPSQSLSLTAGVMLAFDAFFAHFHVQWLTPLLGLMLIAASLGGMLTWLAGPALGVLTVVRENGYLPPFLQALDRHGIPQHILVSQGAITTLIALLSAFIPNVSSAYWIFSVITTQVYLIVYLLMFVAAMRLRPHRRRSSACFRASARTWRSSWADW